MKKFTIVGLYWDNKQTWISSVEAACTEDALDQIPDGISPLAVFSGDVVEEASFDEADWL